LFSPAGGSRASPLYHYDDDEKPGDVEGDGENGVWHVVK
jgi:predicted lipoprotein with Yx(FWY)xxD motif